MSKNLTAPHASAPASDLLIYQAVDGTIKIDVHLEDDTVWLTQEDMTQLFGKAKSTINEHIKNIFAEGELQESDVTKKFGISEFQQKAPNFYNLDVIISVGYSTKRASKSWNRIFDKCTPERQPTGNTGIFLSLSTSLNG